METSILPHLKGKSWELREVEAKAGGGQDSRKKDGQQETGVRKLWAGRRFVEGRAPAGAGLRARPFWLWALGRPFHLLSLCLLQEDRKSPPLSAGLRSRASRHLGERILNGPHLLPLSKQRAPCDRLHKAYTI